MPEKDGFWKRLKKNKKTQQKFLTISMLLLIVLYFPSLLLVKTIRGKEIIHDEKISEDIESLNYIDSYLQDDKKIVFTGWALKNNSKIENIQVVLQALDESEIIVLNTNSYEGTITEKIQPTWETGQKGFKTEFRKRKYKEDVCYEILLRVTYRDANVESEEDYTVKVKTQRYFLNGEIYCYNPVDFVEPVVKDPYLAEIISKGRVCAYDLQNGMYIYQYGNNLFWLVDKKCKYINEKMYIPYHIYTFDIAALPESRKEYRYDNRDFYFADREVSVIDDSYRMAVCNLPEEYVATNIHTGVYDVLTNSWFWQVKLQNNMK